MKDRLYIMEIGESEIKVMAQGLHILLANKPNNKTVESAIEELIQQSPVVRKDPYKHCVYKNKLTAPKGAIGLEKILYKPLS